MLHHGFCTDHQLVEVQQLSRLPSGYLELSAGTIQLKVQETMFLETVWCIAAQPIVVSLREDCA